jgi:hypothetical protein
MSTPKGWLDKTPKRDLLEFNEEEAVGWIVSRLNLVESDVVEIICNYYKPSYNQHFREILLNNSILGFGAKLKVLRNIPGFKSAIVDKMATLSAIRNGFAHVLPTQNVKIVVRPGDRTPTNIRVHSAINVMNSNGKVKSKEYIEYLLEFQMLYNEIRDYTTKATLMRFDKE